MATRFGDREPGPSGQVGLNHKVAHCGGQVRSRSTGAPARPSAAPPIELPARSDGAPALPNELRRFPATPQLGQTRPRLCSACPLEPPGSIAPNAAGLTPAHDRGGASSRGQARRNRSSSRSIHEAKSGVVSIPKRQKCCLLKALGPRLSDSCAQGFFRAHMAGVRAPAANPPRRISHIPTRVVGSRSRPREKLQGKKSPCFVFHRPARLPAPWLPPGNRAAGALCCRTARACPEKDHQDKHRADCAP